MADAVADGGREAPRGTFWSRITNTAAATGPPLLFGVRMWVSVSLALYIAFYLQLDNPSWAGTSAAIVCQPRLGASLRKGWFRMIGTLIGATAIVVLTALFPQDRVAYILTLMLWGSACAFMAALLSNFASYAAALAGYTVAIIASDTLGATGGPSGDVFLLAVTRASEICIGIVSAGVVLAGTDLGSARRNLAAMFTGITRQIEDGFATTLAQAGPGQPDTQPLRREVLRRVIALPPMIDQAIGESSELRFRSPVVQSAVEGQLRALAAWRTVAVHLMQLPGTAARAEADVILRSIPTELRPPGGAESDPAQLHAVAKATAQSLIAAPVGTPSLRLLANQTAKVFAGLSDAFGGLALFASGVAPPGMRPPIGGFYVPDWLPPLLAAVRAFIAIGAGFLFWIVTAWPNGAFAMTFAMIIVLLFGAMGEQVQAVTSNFMLGTVLGTVFAAIITFALLPGLETFVAFSLVLSLYLIPVGAMLAVPWHPVVFTAMSILIVPLIGPTNQMTYDTQQFYNGALAIVAGSGAGALSFRLIPPLSSAFRTHRLLALSLRDLRRLAAAPLRAEPGRWEKRLNERLVVMPPAASPPERSQLLAALFVGSEIIGLCRMASSLGLTGELSAAFTALAQGQSALARARLAEIDRGLASRPQQWLQASAVLEARAYILAISEVLAQHGAFFDGRTLQ